ncbi:MAG: hypothetical protein PHI23_05150 [Candidatus Peribacteraceae bacterium]|nr:hypothetical protein [Candidatus Peribacteraceae bacterium]
MASVDKDKAPSLPLPPWRRSWELIKGISGSFRAKTLELGYGIKAPVPEEPKKDKEEKPKEPEKGKEEKEKEKEGEKDKKKAA